MTIFQTMMPATFTGAVNITVPGQDEPSLLTLTFVYRDREELQDWISKLQGRTDDEAIPELVAGWENVLEGDTPVPYSPDALRRLVLRRFQASAAEIYQAYLKHLRESRAKN